MIIIRHRSGPLAGRRQDLDATSGRITFGRDPAVCDVVFPPDLTIVARRHFALVRSPAGDWVFELFGDPFVRVNGEPADLGEAVHNGATIELGRHGGPSFEIELKDEGLAGSLPLTEPQEKIEDAHMAAARARRFAAVGLVLALLAIVGGGALFYYNRGEGARLDSAIAALGEAQAKAAADTIGVAVREKVAQAAYLVVVRFASGEERAYGTAVPIGPEILATNAHIVEGRETLVKGARMFVRQPGADGKQFEVVESSKHPSYAVFNEFLKSDPFFVMSSKNCPTCYPAILTSVPNYDVGVLKVAAGSSLSPILEIASAEEIANLKAGTPVALAGYPTEGVRGAEVQPLGAVPTLSVGMITAITDMFNMPAESGQRRLIHHNLPTTGGSSGSPMVNSAGKIVALNNAMNVFGVPREVSGSGRIPNPVLINYAQRVDLLTDLMSGKAEKEVDTERAYWLKRTADFKRGIDFYIPQILAELKPKNGATASLIAQEKSTLGKADQVTRRDNNNREFVMRQRKYSVTLEAGKPRTFIAYAQKATNIKLYMLIEGKIVVKDERAVWFPNVSYMPGQDASAEVWVVGPDTDVDYTFGDYGWTAPPS
jgi:V8-like Glu-specific endopeptidase